MSAVTHTHSCTQTHAYAGEERQHDRAPKDLSDQTHYTPGHEHNPEYDHEAFLGKEEAVRFDQLSPVEAKRRLGYVDYSREGL